MDDVRFHAETDWGTYQTLMERTYKTRWFSRSEGEQLGIYEDIREAFAYIGASHLLSINDPHYPSLTAEFLTTLYINIDDPDAEGAIAFRLGNQGHALSLEEFNELLGFPNHAIGYQLADYRVPEVWSYLTGQARCPQHALPGKDIANPLFRIILRILGSTIWAKKELSRPTRRELACLRTMLFQAPSPMNLGYEWLQHVVEYRGKSDELWVGGMVAWIARALDVDLSLYTARQPQLINTNYLLQTSILKKQGNVYRSTFQNREVTLTEENIELLHLPNW